MELKEIQELLKLINRLEFVEFKYKQGDVEFSARTKHYQSTRVVKGVAPMLPPVAAQAPAPAAPAPQEAAKPAPAAGSDATQKPADEGAGDNLIEIR